MVTHDHPEGLRGALALAVAAAVWWALHGVDAPRIHTGVSECFGYDLSQPLDEIRPGYRHSEARFGLPEAIATRALGFLNEDMQSVVAGPYTHAGRRPVSAGIGRFVCSNAILHYHDLDDVIQGGTYL